MRRLSLVSVLLISTLMVSAVPATYGQRNSNRAANDSMAAARQAAETITAAQLRDYLEFVASDEMEGRDTPSRGLDTTAKFIRTILKRQGIKPAGPNGSYFQTYALRRYKVDPKRTHAEVGGQTFTFG